MSWISALSVASWLRCCQITTPSGFRTKDPPNRQGFPIIPPILCPFRKAPIPRRNESPPNTCLTPPRLIRKNSFSSSVSSQTKRLWLLNFFLKFSVSSCPPIETNITRWPKSLSSLTCSLQNGQPKCRRKIKAKFTPSLKSKSRTVSPPLNFTFSSSGISTP